MKKVLYILFAAVAMATACTRETVPEQQSVLTTTVAPKEGDLMRVTFTVTVPETDFFATQTRAPFGEQPNIAAGDVYVAVFGAGESDGIGGSLQNFVRAKILYDGATYLQPPIEHNEHDPYQATPTGTGSFKYKYEVLLPLSNDPLVLDFLVGACDSDGVPYTLNHPLPVGYEKDVMSKVYVMGEQAGYWQRKRISGVFPKIVNGEYLLTQYTSGNQILPDQDQDYVADDIAELQEVKLIRNFAKITYKSSANAPFTIHSFILVDTPRTSALAPYSTAAGYNTAYTTASDAGVIMNGYRGYVLSHDLNSGIEGKTFITASSGDPRNSYGYMYERTIPTNSDPVFAESGAILYVTWNDLSWVTNPELKNSLNLNPNRYYKVSFVDINGYVPILRNIEYRFEVSNIVADTHPTTAAEAYAGAFLGDVSANITTSMLDDISNNKSRIVVAGHTEGNNMSYTAIGSGKYFDVDFYFYPVADNSEVVVTNNKTSTAANAKVTITKDIETNGSYPQAIQSVSDVVVTHNENGSDKYGTIRVTLNDSESGKVKKGKVKILGQVEGFRALYREIEFTVMEKQEFATETNEASATPLTSDAMNQETTVTIVLPDGLPRDIFPLKVKIEAQNNGLTSIPDNTVSPAISALPVKYGKSAFSEKNSYYFVKTITFDDYATLNGTSYEYTNEFPCKFKTRLGNGLNATTIKINDIDEEYFEEKTITLSVQ